MDTNQQRMIVNAIILGCDRNTAAAWANCSIEQLETTLALYPDFATEVAHAEASAELTHIRAISEAAKDPKHWRASQFWLRARNPERYGRTARNLTADQITQFVDRLFAELADHFPDEQIRPIREKLTQLLDELDREN